jgi:hypothetical protein
MRYAVIPLVLLVGWLAGCETQSSVKPVETLDERTGVTVGALKEAIELVPSTQNAVLSLRRRASFAYLGPVELDRAGTISYGLWIHIAPGNDHQPGDIHATGALTLVMDDGSQVLSVIDAPKLGHDPYQGAVSWGQTAYFNLDVDMLKRMAASRKLDLDVRAVGGTVIHFTPTLDTRPVLAQYLQARGITGD